MREHPQTAQDDCGNPKLTFMAQNIRNTDFNL